MRQVQSQIQVTTGGQGFTDITRQVQAEVDRSQIRAGLCHLFVRHTSASLVIQENADPDVLHDLAEAMARLAPARRDYRHHAEGADDMPAHIRSMLTHTSEQIPLADGSLLLGTWQAIYLWEHRRAAHKRHIVLHIIGT